MSFISRLLHPALSAMALLLFTASVLAQEQASPEIRAIENFLTAETVDAGAFAQSFLDQVPAAQLQPVREQLTAGLGEFRKVVADGDRYQAMYDNGSLPVLISLDGSGKIDGLRLLQPELSPAGTSSSTAAPDPADSGPSGNQAEMAMLEQFLTSESIDPGWFSDAFLSQVPEAQLQVVRQQVSAGQGKFLRIEPNPSGDGYRSVYEKGYLPTTISLDSEGRINGLFFRPAVPNVTSTGDAVNKVINHPGKVALLVQKNGETLHAHNAGEPLAVGSAFKLSILAALVDQIDQGDRSWSDIYRLTDGDKSLPSGELRNWPKGAPITLHTLAALMISQSDNTATDALLHALGRDTVEAHAPERNRPFLTTREAFILKNPDNADIAEAFTASEPADRYQLLSDSVDRPMAARSVFESGDTIRPDIEWFYTAAELCEVMASVAGSEVTQINDGGLTDSKNWDSISFKGGSEPGVLNLTYWLTADSGDEYCVTVTRNSEESFEYPPMMGQVSALIDTLEKN